VQPVIACLTALTWLGFAAGIAGLINLGFNVRREVRKYRKARRKKLDISGGAL
jgi:hypothetical protein